MDTLSVSPSSRIASAGELLKKTWALIKERFRTLALLEVIKWIPSVVLLLIFAAGLIPFSDINNVFNNPVLTRTFLPIAIVIGIASIVLQLSGLVAQIYTLAANHSVSLKETLPVVKKRILPFVGYSFLNSAIVLLVASLFAAPLVAMGLIGSNAGKAAINTPLMLVGLLILLVGVLVVFYVSIRLTFTGILAVTEPGMNALKGSWSLTNGNMKVLVARMLVLFFISLLIYVPFALITAALQPSPGEAGIVQAIAAQVIQFIGTFVGTMIGIGYNLQLLRQLQHKPAVQPTPATISTPPRTL